MRLHLTGNRGQGEMGVISMGEHLEPYLAFFPVNCLPD